MLLHVANRVEDLVETYVRNATASDDPFAAEVIAIQSRGMGSWLKMRLAEARGIAANIRFVGPEDVIAEAMAALGVAAKDEEDPWSPGRLAWHVLAAFEDPEIAGLEPLKGYLDGDGAARDRRRVHLAQQIAGVFYRYALYRPQMTEAWEGGEEPGEWQARLWRKLAQRIEAPSPARRLTALIKGLAAGERLADGFPQRVSLFAINTLPARLVDALRALSSQVDVQIYLMVPADQGAEHPLRESFDRLGGELERLLVERGARRMDDFREPEGSGILHALQRDILRGELPAERHPVDDDDRTLQIHACHSPQRQVEVLRDRLLDLFEHDPTLQPRDVLVMTPDIETYAPLIDAVFRDGDTLGTSDGERGFPALHQIHDLSLKRQNPLAEALLAILELSNARLTASEILGLLTLPAVRDVAALDDDDLERVRGWVRASGIRWARDETHRAERGQPADRTHTWRYGFDRLLLGHALADRSPDGFQGICPIDDVEGKETQALGRFVDWVERLFDALQAMKTPRVLDAWETDLSSVIDTLLVYDDRSAGRAQTLRDEIATLAARARRAGYGGPIGIAALRGLLEPAFTARRPAINFLSGGMTFCTMVPMRNIPFGVICLLGMDDGHYPRTPHGVGFDRIERSPREPGDRSARDDDRTIFLETLMAARRHLLVTYTGRSVADNRPLEPAGPIAELISVLKRSVAGVDSPDDALPAPLFVTHPLQPFSEHNFRGDPPPSYDRRYLAAARILRGPRTPKPRLLSGPLAAPTEALTAVTLRELVRFYQCPTTWFLKTRLGIDTYEDDDETSDLEPLTLNGLDQWKLRDHATRWALTDTPPDDDAVDGALRHRGLAPPGQLATACLDAAREQAAGIADEVRPLLTDTPRRVPVDLDLGDLTLTGAVDGIRGGCRVRFQAGKIRTKHRLALWIRHLALRLAEPDQPRDSVCVGLQETLRLRPPTADVARQILSDLVKRYIDAHTEPLRFFPDDYLDPTRLFGQDVRKDADSEATKADLLAPLNDHVVAS